MKEYGYINNPFVYCINTSNKKIQIKDDLFLDWDDINDKDIIDLYNHHHLKVEQIHSILDGGFMGNTLIEKNDGTFTRIDEIQIGDILKYGTKVQGIVSIDGKDIHFLKEFNINNTTIIGGSNLQIIDKYLGNLSTLDMDGYDIQNPNELFHLITDTKTFVIGNIQFRDYNGAMEVFYKENIDNLLSLV